MPAFAEASADRDGSASVPEGTCRFPAKIDSDLEPDYASNTF